MFDITVSTVLGPIQRSILRLESCQSLKRKIEINLKRFSNLSRMAHLKAFQLYYLNIQR